ncbi:Hypothetical protein A7982_06894 [Minicystis rosea]|nr:Hypothetical protein A7982_06894 [Minicystis rosea]
MVARSSARHPIIAALIALVALIVPALAFAEETERVIVATGSATVHARPDSVRLTVGVEAQGRTLEEVQKEANGRMTRVIEALQAKGIPNLKLRTSILSFGPVYAAPTEGSRVPQIVGYSASNTLSASVRKVPVDKLGAYASAILGAAVDAGANVSGGFELFLDDPSALEAQALENAVKDARNNAEVMARAAGVTVTGVASVSEAAEVTPRARALQYAPSAGAVQTPVETGEIVVSSAVTLKLTFR